MNPSTAETTERWYAEYYARRGADRNDILKNPGVLLQNLAGEAALIRALSFIGYEPDRHTVLDVGGGGGGSLMTFLAVGAPSANLTCVDILKERIAEGVKRLPGVRFICADASQSLPGGFDIVWASTMFVQLTDDALAKAIADKMRNAVKPGGHILIRDWSFPKPWDGHYKPLSKSRFRELFDGVAVRSFRSSLVPPLGRMLSAHAPALYFPVAALFPFLVAQRVYVLKLP